MACFAILAPTQKRPFLRSCFEVRLCCKVRVIFLDTWTIWPNFIKKWKIRVLLKIGKISLLGRYLWNGASMSKIEESGFFFFNFGPR